MRNEDEFDKKGKKEYDTVAILTDNIGNVTFIKLFTYTICQLCLYGVSYKSLDQKSIPLILILTKFMLLAIWYLLILSWPPYAQKGFLKAENNLV